MIAWEKRYTEDHEWIELSDDKKTGMSTQTPYRLWILLTH